MRVLPGSPFYIHPAGPGSARHSSNSQDIPLPTRKPRGGTGMALSLSSSQCPAFPQRCSKPLASKQRGRAAGCNSSAGRRFKHASVAQRSRAPGFEPGGCGFKSCRERQISPRGPTAEAPVLETGGWGCESPRGHQFFSGNRHPDSSVAEKAMHSSRKGDHVGATPAGGTTFAPIVYE